MKPLGWIGSAKDDLLSFPEDAIREMVHALFVAQMGGKHVSAKPLKGLSEEEYAKWQKQKTP